MKLFHSARSHLALAVFCAVLVQGCGRGDDPDNLLSSAQGYLDKRDFNAAAIQLKTVLQKQPENAKARYLLGSALLEMGDAANAEKELRKAVEYKYPDPAAVARVARAMRMQGSSDKVLKEFSGDAADGEANPALLTEVGMAELDAGRIAQAKVAFEKALAAAPATAIAKVGLALVALRQDGDKAKANALTQEALAADPAQMDALMVKADLLLAEGNEAGAIAAYREVQKNAPWNYLAANNLVIMLNEKKDYEGARQALATFRKAAPGDLRAPYLQGVISYREGHLDPARDAVLQTLKAAPTYPPALLLAGAIDFDARKYVQAAEHFRKVVESKPNDPRPRVMLATSMLRAGQVARAASALEPLMKSTPDSPGVLALAGEIALAKGDPRQALEYFEKASAKSKDDASLRTRAAQARMATGEYDRAVRELEQLAATDAKNTQADLALISGFIAKRQFDRVFTATQSLRKKVPDSALPDQLDGVAHLGKGEKTQAREAFTKALQKQFDNIPAVSALAQLDLQEGKVDDAMGRFKSILEKSPNNVSALLALAGIQAGTHQPRAEVQATLERAVKADPQSAEARLALLDFLGTGKDPDKTLQAAREANAAIPDNPRLLERLGMAQRAAGDANQALASFSKAASLVPTAAGPHVRIASLHLENKNYSAAETSLQKAISLEPTNPAANELLVGTYIAQKKYDAAVQAAKAFEKAAPRIPAGPYLEARAYAGAQRWNDAETALRRSLAMTPSPIVAGVLYDVMVRGGKEAAAESFAQSWITQRPKDTGMLTYLGDRAMADGKYALAAQRYKEGLARRGDDPVVLNNLAWVLGKLKDPKAVDYARKALELAPDSAAIKDTLGMLLAEAGKLDEGLAMLRSARDEAPNIPAIRINHATLLARSGDKEAARKDLENFLTTLPAESPSRDAVRKAIESL